MTIKKHSRANPVLQSKESNEQFEKIHDLTERPEHNDPRSQSIFFKNSN